MEEGKEERSYFVLNFLRAGRSPKKEDRAKEIPEKDFVLLNTTQNEKKGSNHKIDSSGKKKGIKKNRMKLSAVKILVTLTRRKRIPTIIF